MKFLVGSLSTLNIYEQDNHLLYEVKKGSTELEIKNRSFINDFADQHVKDDDDGTNLKRYNIGYYTFNVTGFELSLSLLKLLLGHPKFYQNIFNTFVLQ